MTNDTKVINPRPLIDIDPVAQAAQACPKCGMTAWKRELRRYDGNESRMMHDGVVTSRTWFSGYESLTWTCWPCGYSFDTNTVEDYLRDHP